jgi:hypothetical protein
MNKEEILALGMMAHALPEMIIIQKLDIAIQKYKMAISQSDEKVREEMLFEIQLASTLLVIKRDCNSPYEFLLRVESFERAERIFHPNQN